MAYTYPVFNGWPIVPMPRAPGPKQISFRQNDSVGMTQSPFTLQSQVQAWPGADWWEADVSLPPMSAADARAWIAFLAALRGKANVFQMGDPSWPVPEPGVYAGAPTLNGAHLATATLLTTTGWTTNFLGNYNYVSDPDAVNPSVWSNVTSQNATTVNPNGIVNLPGAGAVSGNGWGLFGSGGYSAASVYVQTGNMTIAAGSTYWTACYVDARGVAPGGQVGYQALAFNSSNPSNLTLVAQATQTPGQTGQIAAQATIPSGCNMLILRLVAFNSCKISPTTPVVWSNPQVNNPGGLLPYSSNCILQPGDYLQVGMRLHMVAGPIGVYPDGNGNAQIEIWPSLRENQASGLLIGVYNPTGLFRLADNKREWSVDEARHAGISFKAVEAR